MVSPSNTGLGRRTSSQPRFAITFCDTSLTLCPVTSANVSALLTNGFPNSVCAADWWSKWIGAVFCVRSVNQMLSAVGIVRPSACSYTRPPSKSSKNRPFQPSLTVMAFPFFRRGHTVTACRDHGTTYDSRMQSRRSGRSGLKLPAISLGLWQNFGGDAPFERQRAIVRRAFELGITHFDLANNYGPPPGSAEENFGRMLASDLHGRRDELVISTKAGYDMWPGPYGEWGSRKYLLARLDQSLKRMGLDYFDIFYSHRFDPDTPLEETMGALDSAVRQGKALYAGISSYSARRTKDAASILRRMGTPPLIHQPSYSMLNRWIEPELLDVLGKEGMGCIVFSPLAQGLLTDRYPAGVPSGARASHPGTMSAEMLTEENLAKIRALNEIASRRGQALAQMAVAWTLRTPVVTSALLGASSVAQLEQNVAALNKLEFSPGELEEIDRYATDSGINLW